MTKWKDRVIDLLRDLAPQRAACDNIPIELKRLELESVSIRGANLSVPVVQSKNTTDKMLWNLVQRQDLERNLAILKQHVEFVESGLSVLQPEEAEVIERVYVNREKDVIERLREEWEMAEKRSVYKRLEKILNRLTIAMYGMTKSF